jgi:hypothetical protein
VEQLGAGSWTEGVEPSAEVAGNAFEVHWNDSSSPVTERPTIRAVGATVLAILVGWAAYRWGRWWIAAVPLILTAIVAILILATERPLNMTTVPFIAIVSLGALGGLWARHRQIA